MPPHAGQGKRDVDPAAAIRVRQFHRAEWQQQPPCGGRRGRGGTTNPAAPRTRIPLRARRALLRCLSVPSTGPGRCPLAGRSARGDTRTRPTCGPCAQPAPRQPRQPPSSSRHGAKVAGGTWALQSMAVARAARVSPQRCAARRGSRAACVTASLRAAHPPAATQTLYAFAFGTEARTSLSIFAFVTVLGVLLGFVLAPDDAPPPYNRISAVIGWVYFSVGSRRQRSLLARRQR